MTRISLDQFSLGNDNFISSILPHPQVTGEVASEMSEGPIFVNVTGSDWLGELGSLSWGGGVEYCFN